MDALPREQFEEAMSNLAVVTDKVGRATQQKVGEVMGWFGQLFQQLNAMPVATPAATPFLRNVDPNAPVTVYYTQEGRLKTCVNR